MPSRPPQYEPIVTKGNEALVHHMEVFQCSIQFERVPPFSGPCDSKMKPDQLNYCRHVLAAWALGAKVRPPLPGALPTWVQGAPESAGEASRDPRPSWPPTQHCLLSTPLGHEGFFQPLWHFYRNKI